MFHLLALNSAHKINLVATLFCVQRVEVILLPNVVSKEVLPKSIIKQAQLLKSHCLYDRKEGLQVSIPDDIQD